MTLSPAQAKAGLLAFAAGETDYVSGCLPSDVVQLDARLVLDALYRRLGGVLAKALSRYDAIPSPKSDQPDGLWLRDSNCVGINLRTTGGLLGALKFVLTLPPHINAVHLLPVFEPGVVGSLYGLASWRINAEFFDPTWARIAPALHDVTAQLHAFINICHALGKTVGLDVIPHVDRFSEISLANPWLFEWVRRSDVQILDRRADLHFEVERAIALYARGHSGDDFARQFFARPEGEILDELFGGGSAPERNMRRDDLIQYLYERGYETLPATMAPPYRGLELDPRDEAVTVDDRGRRWRDYCFVKPQAMSRAFGPLTRYKLFEREDENRDWVIDHDRPRHSVWQYFAEHYRAIVLGFGFDFLRGDMSHVQTRPKGVPEHPDEYYDIHAYVKRAIAAERPHIAYFAESFLTADDFMTYGSETEHLNASHADVALGNLQGYAPHESTFHELLAEYEGLCQNQSFAPCFTIFSADKDDPRFDASFNNGSVARYFFAAFCPRFPSYTSLGFRQRDEHSEPVANEYYSKLYVFHYDEGPKATRGPYRWGDNQDLYQQIAAIDACKSQLQSASNDFEWLLSPDATGRRKILAWRVGEHNFAVNFGVKAAKLTHNTTGAESTFGSLDSKGRIQSNSGIAWLLPPDPVS